MLCGQPVDYRHVCSHPVDLLGAAGALIILASGSGATAPRPSAKLRHPDSVRL